MQTSAQELLRALRGQRSQASLSRRLGYKSAVCADWEQGLRAPTATVFFDLCRHVGIDLYGAITAFHAPSAAAFDPTGPSRWYRALRGGTAISELSDRTGRSRYAVGRWLSGSTQPRLPDLLALLDALTGRVQDFIAALVDIERVPSMTDRVRRADASRDVGVLEPWTLAVLLAIESGVDEGDLAVTLERPQEQIDRCVALLEQAGVIVRQQRLTPGAPLTIDTQRHPDAGRTLKRFWGQVGVDRIDAPGAHDVLSFNLFACSVSDFMRIRALQRQFYREARSIVAASENSEVVALLNAQLIRWG